MVYNFPEEAHIPLESSACSNTPPQRSSTSAVIVVQSTQDWHGDDLAIIVMGMVRLTIPFWNLLPDALMRPGSVEVVYIGIENPLELLLLQDEQVIETLATHTAQKAFTDRIGPWCVIGCFQDLDAAGCCHACETGSKLVITITNEILRRLSKGSCFPQLLRSPGIGRRASDPHMDDSARVQFDDEEGKQGAKEEVGDLQEITRPDVFGMILQEGSPGLSSWSCGTDLPHVLLDGAFADADA